MRPSASHRLFGANLLPLVAELAPSCARCRRIHSNLSDPESSCARPLTHHSTEQHV